MTTTLDRTQYPISPDALERDLFDIGDKLDMLEEFTDGVEDTHLSPQEHHLVHRQKRLLILLRDVLKEHLELIVTSTDMEARNTTSPIFTATTSNALGSVTTTCETLVSETTIDAIVPSNKTVVSYNLVGPDAELFSIDGNGTLPFNTPIEPNAENEVKLITNSDKGITDIYPTEMVFTNKILENNIAMALHLRDIRMARNIEDNLKEDVKYIEHLISTGIYTNYSINESALSVYLHTRQGTVLELVDVLVKRELERT